MLGNVARSSSSFPSLYAEERAHGFVQRVDANGREIAVLLATGVEYFFVPPDCPIFLHGERIKLRLIQPRDHVRVTFDGNPGMLIVKLLEVQPDGSFPRIR